MDGGSDSIESECDKENDSNGDRNTDSEENMIDDRGAATGTVQAT